MSAFDFNPEENVITTGLIFSLNQCFKTSTIVALKENGKESHSDMVNELANDILTIREASK